MYFSLSFWVYCLCQFNCQNGRVLWKKMTTSITTSGGIGRGSHESSFLARDLKFLSSWVWIYSDLLLSNTEHNPYLTFYPSMNRIFLECTHGDINTMWSQWKCVRIFKYFLNDLLLILFSNLRFALAINPYITLISLCIKLPR